MSKPKNHIPGLAEIVSEYADKRMLDFIQFSPYHMRVTDGGYTSVDMWTTGRYFIGLTDYAELTDGSVTERQGEKGNLPIGGLQRFLDKIFFLNEELAA